MSAHCSNDIPPARCSLSAMTRRSWLAGAMAGAALGLNPREAGAVLNIDVTQGNIKPIPIAIPDFVGGTPNDGAVARDVSQVITANLKRSGLFAPIDPAERFLYHVEDYDSATRYGVSVGRAGLELKGTAYVGRKAKWPFWRPTRSMIRRSPDKYARYADGMRGGPNNPLGARALYLYRGNEDTYYRIHGTNQPSSIGRAVSNGCVRMLNAHVEELYERVPVGTFVVIL